MQKTILLIAVVIAASYSIFGQTTGKQSSTAAKTEREVIALTNRFAEAVVKRDVGALEHLLADDYIDVLPDGTTASKAQIIAGNKKPLPDDAGKLEAIDVRRMKVRLYGAAALVTLHITFRGQAANRAAFSNAYTTTAAAVKQNGRWRIASIQSTAIEPSKPAASPTN